MDAARAEPLDLLLGIQIIGGPVPWILGLLSAAIVVFLLLRRPGCRRCP